MDDGGDPHQRERQRDLRAEGRRHSATQADVAAAAGVSTATVSRVLNGSPLVRADVRAKVERAVTALGYVPNSAARALALARTHTVGAIIPTLNNAIFAQGVNAFEAALRARGYTLLLSVSNYDPAAGTKAVTRMIERGVDGLMLVGTDHDPETAARLGRAGTPVVCTWSFDTAAPLPTVGFDNHGAMEAVVDHLARLGHRHIAMLAGPTPGNDRARHRVSGVRAALRARGLALSALMEAPYQMEAARAAAASLLEAARPTALICGNDVIAYGALFAASDIGIAVPDALSVVGFDDLALSARLPPGLTTVRVPAVAMGEAAAVRLVEAIEGAAPITPVELATELVVRGSTAAPTTR